MKFIITSLSFLLLLSLYIYSYAVDNEQAKTDLVIQTNKIFDPNKLSLDSLSMYEKTFNFDWNNYDSVMVNRPKIQEVENFVKSTHSSALESVPPADREAYGKILYKAGTYYLYVTHQNDLAINRLLLANEYLTAQNDKAWNYNQLGFAYELKFAESRAEKDKDKALHYSDKVIAQSGHAKNKAVAFAYNIKGMVENDDRNFGNAERYLQKAVKIYESMPEGKDEQYAATKNRLAGVILSMNDRDKEAIAIFEQLKDFWAKKGNAKSNPQAAFNLIWLGQAYLKIGNPKEALEEINAGINVYQNLYGEKSTLLCKPYRLLSTTYKTLGDDKLADSYAEKASSLNPKAKALAKEEEESTTS